MAAHLDVPSAAPEQIAELKRKLGEIEKKLDDALAPKVEEPKPTARPRTR